MVFKKRTGEVLKKKIEQILNNPPTYEEMIIDLRMNNVLIKQKAGDLSLLKSIDKSLLEKVWKSYKITNLIEQNSKKLKTLGVSSRAVQKQTQSLSRQLYKEVDKISNGPIEGFLEGGFLELEVFGGRGGVIN